MDKEDDLLEGQTDSEENLFDLSLDDLTPEDIDHEPAEEETDEDIIELMDLVEKGEKDLESGDWELAPFLEEEKPTEELKSTEAPGGSSDDAELLSQMESDLDLNDITLDSDLNIEEGAKPAEELLEEDIARGDIEKVLEEEGSQVMDMTLDGDIEPEESFEDFIETSDLEEHLIEEGAGLEEELSKEDTAEGVLDHMPEPAEEMDMAIESPISSEESQEGLEEEPEVQMEVEPLREEIAPDEAPAEEFISPDEEKSTEHFVDEAMVGISEEKIEAIVTRVVGDVVERVARETMADVAEKLIREAIDTLKQSLDTDSD